MNILIVGAGGREHTLAWKLKQSASCKNLFIAPGNAGTATCGTNLQISTTDFEALANAAAEHNVDMLIVGPEEPLVKGIVDFFKNAEATKDIHIIGPSTEASQLEGSKAYAKSFMLRHNIPTAAYQEFTAENFDEGLLYIQQHSLPIVLKADGLAAGKGVLICQSHVEASAEFELMIHRNKFGEAGAKVVIEEFLEGIEMSVFALTDGKNYVLLPEAKDYKRIGKGDTGPNTGGMGAVSPVPFADEAFMLKVKKMIVEPTVKGLQTENLVYIGIVFIGIIKVGDEPFVIEYNCRLGDPETEVVIPRIKNDLVAVFSAAATGHLNEISIETIPQTAVTVVAVSGGYPNEYETGKPILGLQDTCLPGTIIFHAGTRQQKNEILTNGGRVLAVTSFADNITDASEQSIYQLEHIFFEGIYYRSDIGFEFL